MSNFFVHISRENVRYDNILSYFLDDRIKYSLEDTILTSIRLYLLIKVLTPHTTRKS